MDKKEKNKYGLDVAAEKLNLPKYDVREDLSVGVEPLYDDEMESLQGRIRQPQPTPKAAMSVKSEPSRLNIPKYDVKEDLSVGVEPLYDDEMESLMGGVKRPVQTVKGAELPEVEVTASAPRRRLEMPKYEHDLPKTIAQRDIQPVQKTTRDYMDELRELLKQDGESREREAKRKRDLAMIADLANLTVNAGSVAGGGNSVKQEMATKAASERLQAIRDKNAAQIRDFAVRRAEAKERARLEENRNVVQKDRNALEREKLNRDIANDDAENARKDAESKANVDLKNAQANYYRTNAEKGNEKPAPRVREYNGVQYDLNSDDDYRKLYAAMAREGNYIIGMDPNGFEYVKKNPDIKEVKNFVDNHIAGFRVNGVMPGVATGKNNKMPGVK